jgi:hypothetical protein
VGTWEARSLDGGTGLAVSRDARRPCVTVDGRSDGCFDGIALGTVVFSPGGGHVAYSASLDGRWTVVHDGVQKGRWEGVGGPELSADGSRVAYAALAGGAWRVIVDGDAGEPFDSILEGSLRFGPGGGAVAYAATRHGRTHVVADGSASRAWDAVARLTFDAPGDHLAYAARDEEGARVAAAGWAGPAHEAVGELVLGGHRAPVAEGSPPVRMAYAARDASLWRVIVDGVEGEPFDSVRQLALLEDGSAGYVAGRGGREAVVRGSSASEWHDRVGALAWGPGGRWGYAAEDADGAVVVLDGVTVARARWAGDVAFGREGRHAYLVGDHRGAVVVDERGRHAFDLVLRGSLLYVANGRAWACLAGDRARRELHLVVDGVRRERFDWAAVTREAERGGDESRIREWVVARAEAALAGEPRHLPRP